LTRTLKETVLEIADLKGHRAWGIGHREKIEESGVRGQNPGEKTKNNYYNLLATNS
jgi:hypothetical protein